MANDRRYEINHSGEIVEGVSALCSQPNKMLNNLLNQFGWEIEDFEEDGLVYTCKLKSASGVLKNITIYAGRIRNEARNPYEKKIQLNSKDPRRSSRDNTIILGIYVFNENDSFKDAVFVGYPIDDSIDYSSNPSIRGTMVNGILVEAKNNGFVYDGKHNTVGFRSEFIYYYLDNFSTIHYEGKEYQTIASDVNNQDVIVDNEQAFREWMAQQKKDNGELYADTTIEQECSRIKNAKSKDSIKDIIPCENLFEISDAKLIDKVRKDLENKIVDDESVKNETDGLPNALNLYYNFLVWKHSRISFESNYSSNKPYNRIIFGAPGTGKSHLLEEQKNELLKETKGSYERVTFHPDYSYAQFVGTYKPVSYGDEDNKKIKYEFVPGPFTRVLVKALKNCIQVQNGGKAEPYLLIIEELNRAKTAAVFGDVFQLLDRKNGVSEYEIETSQDLRKYLANELGVSEDSVSTIKIPNNMFIWATMNSADQGVFPLDMAFKRRWSFEYVDVDNNEDKNDVEFNGIKWNVLRKAINDVLSGDDVRAHEDKLLGAFFIKFKDGATDEEKVQVFCDKVLMYLFDDVARSKRKYVFDENVDKKVLNRFSSVVECFKKNRIEVFNKNIKEVYKEYNK